LASSGAGVDVDRSAYGRRRGRCDEHAVAR
jgi:hypothetical protein